MVQAPSNFFCCWGQFGSSLVLMMMRFVGSGDFWRLQILCLESWSAWFDIRPEICKHKWTTPKWSWSLCAAQFGSLLLVKLHQPPWILPLRRSLMACGKDLCTSTRFEKEIDRHLHRILEGVKLDFCKIFDFRPMGYKILMFIFLACKSLSLSLSLFILIWKSLDKFSIQIFNHFCLLRLNLFIHQAKLLSIA